MRPKVRIHILTIGRIFWLTEVNVFCPQSDSDDETPPTDPAVVPLAHLGVVDIDGVEVTDAELMAHALANCSQLVQEEDYLVRRGSAFVNEYARIDPATGQRTAGGPADANHLLGSFPTLFPYGLGGFEIERQVNVSYEAHARWALQYEDRRFRKDPHFPFQVFGVCQKRQVCRASILQMKRGAYLRHQNLLSTITAEDLLKASQEETRGVPFTNPAVRTLRSQLTAVKTKVQGSDESRLSVRGKIWGTNLLHNPPSLWVTINPADTQDPIAQVLAGADIDLNDFCNTAGPDGTDRAINIAADPYASAKFFHFMIETILEVLFGISKRRNGIFLRKEGIFGRVKSYIGTVEAQGRGSLHLHLLLWLEGAPTAKELKSALKNNIFREKVKTFIKETIRADIGGKKTMEVLAMPKVDAVSYSRPLDPRTHDSQTIASTEESIARSTQYHQCSVANCLKTVKGRLVCKRHAPFPLAADDWVDSDGGWGPRRLCGFLNNWNPTLTRTLRANHDIKLIMNGEETNVLTWYITNYAAKKQNRSSNISALLAKRVAFHTVEERRRNDLSDINKRLIQRCANTLARDREFSGPEIMSYLMGWGDRYESHHYVGISADAILAVIREQYPELKEQTRPRPQSGPVQGTMNTSNSDVPSTVGGVSDQSHTIVVVAGSITLKDHLHEYAFRGEGLTEMSYLDFMLDTYDAKADRVDPAETFTADDDHAQYRPSGRTPNRRVPYREGFTKPGRCRVFRTTGHETLPHFMGGWFPRNDRPREREVYCASMLTLLKPWTELSQLKLDVETFEEVFDSFVEAAPKRTTDIIENIQYYYECYDGAKRRRDAQTAESETNTTMDCGEGALSIDPSEELMDVSPVVVEITGEDIDMMYKTRGSMRERLHAEVALNTAFDHAVFPERTTDTVFLPTVEKAHNDDLKRFQAWEEQLKAVCRRETEEGGPALFPNVDGAAPVLNSVNELPGVQAGDDGDNRPLVGGNRPKRELLRDEQRRAHDIIEAQLLKRMAGKTKPSHKDNRNSPSCQETTLHSSECWFWVMGGLGNQC